MIISHHEHWGIRCWGSKLDFWIVLFIGPPGPGGAEGPEAPPSEVGPRQTIQNTTMGASSNQGNVFVGQCNTGNQCQSISVIRARKYWWTLKSLPYSIVILIYIAICLSHTYLLNNWSIKTRYIIFCLPENRCLPSFAGRQDCKWNQQTKQQWFSKNQQGYEIVSKHGLVFSIYPLSQSKGLGIHI